MPEYQYRKSTYSDPEAECVETATNIPTTIAIRDSKNPTGPSLRLHPTTWTAFQTALLTKQLTTRPAH
ncbi:DUF397 domain-containing protein [Streptomyces ureilyticus]|uniref:DUF397 domain-containing protein n=1 Tax=Streptomyces ureilyticus TaxID=1775131 RepID=A0ABX0E452_9ACTN|nr:DUF397 domain-containing protein [Streptomyces ureilyticus]NGO48468.1 DUF397 domain-containing protein [Streptomyces ureilyticus]